MPTNPHTALLVLHPQIDFGPGGTLEMTDSERALAVIARLQKHLPYCLAAMDAHPANHVSFAGSHPWRLVGQQLEIDGLSVRLQPMHGVRGSFGALLANGLDRDQIHHQFELGTEAGLDGYSAFFDADQRRATGLHEWLQSQDIRTLLVSGLNHQNGLFHTVMDALELGYQTILLLDACAGWNVGDMRNQTKEMARAGVFTTSSDQFLQNWK